MRATIVSIFALLSGVPLSSASAQDLDDARLEPAFLGFVTGRLGATLAGGRSGIAGGGRIDGVAVDSGGLKVSAFRAEINATSADFGAFGAELLSLDYAIVEQSSTLRKDGERVGQFCLFLINAPCTNGGVIGVGTDLLAWQTSLDSGRRAWRFGELDIVGSPEPATNPGWIARRFPLRFGVSIDEIERFAGLAATWVPRLDFGADALMRFAEGRAELDMRVRYRPSLRAFSDDYGIEATVYLGYRSRYYVVEAQGAPVGVGLELGYAHWSNPLHAFGVAWAENATNTSFVRAVFSGAAWAIH